MKKVYLSYNDIHTDCIKLANIIKKKYRPKKLLILNEKELITGSIIANILNIKNVKLIEIKKYKKILSKERLMLISDHNHIELNYKIIKKIIPNCKIISLYTKTKTKKYVDISLYNFKSNEELIFPWELK
ncbi:hypothetical protein OAQ08_03745 [Alphaproteobacteria bacterium]|nr:hypothetical protein [Alphaproteobacteria bacterium]